MTEHLKHNILCVVLVLAIMDKNAKLCGRMLSAKISSFEIIIQERQLN